MNVEYYIIDPTGNITALVTSDIDKRMYKAVAQKIMENNSSVEQVGFVRFDGDNITLNMSGDEFCGNATMSAAVLFYSNFIKNGVFKANANILPFNISVPVEVKNAGDYYDCSAVLPLPNKVFDYTFSARCKEYCFPAVSFSGITHIVADSTLSDDCAKAVIKDLAIELNTQALGIMVFDNKTGALKPFVYVAGVDTLFLENSCASGSCAVACLQQEYNKKYDIVQPGGVIGATKLYAGIRLDSKIKIEEHFVMEM